MRQEYHRFHYGSPLPVREVSTETEDPGGAGKVALPEATGLVLCFKSAPSYGPTTLLSQLGPSDQSNAIPPRGKATFPELVRGRFKSFASDAAFTKITPKPKTVWQLEFP